MGGVVFVGGYVVNNLGVVFDYLSGVEGVLLVGEVLYDYFGVFID